MHRNKFDEILNRHNEEIQRSKSMDIQDVAKMLMGDTASNIVTKPTKRFSSKQKAERAERIAELKAHRDESIDPTDRIEEIDSIPEIEEIDHIDTIDPLPVPDGFPEGTIMNDDATLTLPDGRMIQKIQEVSDVEA